ncbi:endo alpha-1,4 polygalactosaminidase [Embleya sp. AB8]|uniref:endo alpha-1,4 polygalactosaminidase n=1 Tax=Embleya sp. AB8 TaxID=3156304 RepID=UPI003C70C54A
MAVGVVTVSAQAGTGGAAPAPAVAAAASAPVAPGVPVAPPTAVRLPPTRANFDYQIGGGYTPPAGVKVTSRDRGDSPAPGLYNICYVNGFQIQPGEEAQWDPQLLLRDANGDLVIDEKWNEVVVDISTPDKRAKVADKVGAWIDGCAARGFDGLELDNYESHSRSKGLLTPQNDVDMMSLFSARAHSRNLAVAQKNGTELAAYRNTAGVDFAVAEECGQHDECNRYAAVFGDNVIDIEYNNAGLSAACEKWGDRLSIVQRDLDVLKPGASKYVRRTCA